MTKKIFTLLTALVLSMGIGWAQSLPSASWGAFFPGKSGEYCDSYNVQDANGDWNMSQDKFLRLRFWSSNRSSNNFVRFFFWLDKNNWSANTYSYANIVGPKPGTYTLLNPAQYSNANYGYYWYYSDNSGLNKYVVGNKYSTIWEVRCPFSSFGAQSGGNGLYYTNTVAAFLDGATITVEEGKNGNIYIVVSKDGATYVTVGEPKICVDGTLSVSAGQGTISVDGGNPVASYIHEYAGGTKVSLAVQGYGSGLDEYVFDSWNDGYTDNPREVTIDGDKTYTAFFRKKYNYVHAFSWNDIGEAATDPEWDVDGDLTIYRLYWTSGGFSYPSLELQLLYDASKLQDYGSMTGPPEGTYTIHNSVYDLYEYAALGATESGYQGSYKSCYWENSTTYDLFRKGTITISQGANGKPYIVVDAGQGNGTENYFYLTVGEPASTVTTHKVTFRVEGQEDVVMDVTVGDAPVYTGETPTKASTASTVYTFAGWKSSIDGKVYATDNLPKVGSSDVTYTASFTGEIRIEMENPTYTNKNDYFTLLGTTSEYTVYFWSNYPLAVGDYTSSFIDFNNTYVSLGADRIPYSNATCKITQNANKYCVEVKFFANNGNIYNAIFYVNAGGVATHTVTFKNYDGTQLQSGQVEEGQTPAYTGETPTKESTAQYDYTFAGWNPAITAVGTEDQVYTATFSETTRQYTVTITAPTNGTIKVMNDATPISSGTKVDYGTTLTINATPATGYSFVDWIGDIEPSDPGFGASQVGTITIEDDETIGATFAIETYTLTIDHCTGGTYTVKIGDADASTATAEKTEIGGIPYGTKITLEAYPTENFNFTGWQRVEEIEEWGAPRRAVTFEMDDEPGSIVEGGSDEELKTANPFVFQMTEDVEYQATFRSSLVSHTLTLYPTMSAGSTGYIKVTGNNETFTSPTDSEDPVVCTIYEGIEYTCKLISNDNNGWGWWLEGDGSILSSEQVKTITPTADVDLYAGFGLERVELDGKNSVNSYETYENKMIHELVYLRTFTAKNWFAMWMPFNFDVTQQGLSGKVYTLSKTAIEPQAEGIIDVVLTFHKYTSGSIEAGERFLLYSAESAPNFVFQDIMMTDFAPDNDKLFGDAATHSEVYFIGAIEPHQVGYTMDEAERKSYRYLKNNVLYYPANQNGIKANTFTGYFQMKDYEYWYVGGSSAAPRMRIIVDDETVITEAGTDNEVETRKYINDEGNLIIERNGTKYTANGAVIE